jgi:hypothetical protein
MKKEGTSSANKAHKYWHSAYLKMNDLRKNEQESAFGLPAICYRYEKFKTTESPKAGRCTRGGGDIRTSCIANA